MGNELLQSEKNPRLLPISQEKTKIQLRFLQTQKHPLSIFLIVILQISLESGNYYKVCQEY